MSKQGGYWQIPHLQLEEEYRCNNVWCPLGGAANQEQKQNDFIVRRKN